MFFRFSLGTIFCISLINVNLCAQTYSHDSLAVRILLDKNNLLNTSVTSISTKGNDRIESLHLTGLKLLDLVPEIGNLEGLKSLDLDSNLLDTLPKEIGNLTGLIELNLNSNSLTQLPPQIGNLKQLLILNASENNLTTLPPEIGNMDNLTYLTLNRNSISALPVEFGSLVFLLEVDLSANALTQLPETFSYLFYLENLDLGFNRIQSLPTDITQISVLKSLSLQSNQLCTMSAAQITWANTFNPTWSSSQNCNGGSPGRVLPQTKNLPAIQAMAKSNHRLFLQTNFKSNIPVNISFFDIRGQIVFQSLQVLNNQTGLWLNDINIPSGLYWVKVRGPDKVLKTKVIW